MQKIRPDKLKLILILVIILLVNFIADKFYFRIDFTDDQRFTLSNATKYVLNDLKETVTVKAYFSSEMPPDVSKVREEFKDLLDEYKNYSDHKLEYEFINPNENDETEQKAQQEGIRPIMINVRERDQMKQQRAYLGASIQLEDKKEIISFVQPNSSIEYDITSAIKKLSTTNKPPIRFLQGQGEAQISEMPQLIQQLEVIYHADTISLKTDKLIPDNIKALIIVSPKDSFNVSELNILGKYINNGGNVLFALDNVKADFTTSRGYKVDIGIDKWIEQFNVRIENYFLTDANCSSVMVRQQQGMYVINTPISFPYIPIISRFADHSISKGLEMVIMPFASPINITYTNNNFHVTPIVFSSEKSGKEKVPVSFDISKQWNEDDFKYSSIIVGTAIKGSRTNNDSKIVLFSDGDFLINGEGEQAQQLQPDNINLAANAIDWLADDTGLIELRTKSVTSRPLNSNLDETSKTFIKYFNFLLPLLLIIYYGIYRYRFNQKLRRRLHQEHYV